MEKTVKLSFDGNLSITVYGILDYTHKPLFTVSIIKYNNLNLFI